MQTVPHGTGHQPLRLPVYSDLGNEASAFLGRYEGLSWKAQCYGIQPMAPRSAVPANWAASLPGRGSSSCASPASFRPPIHSVFPSLASKHGSSLSRPAPRRSTGLYRLPWGPAFRSSFWMLLRFKQSCLIVCMHRFSRWPKRHARGSAMVRPVSRSPSLLIFAPHRVRARLAHYSVLFDFVPCPPA